MLLTVGVDDAFFLEDSDVYLHSGTVLYARSR